MAINKVVYGNQVLIDITDSTVNPNTLLAGYKAYGANGQPVNGALQLSYHITLHEAQYNALSESEKMADENWFYIDDIDSIGAELDDSAISPAKVWSSQKTNNEIQDVQDQVDINTTDIGTLNSALPKLLWTNPNPAAAFEGDVNVDLSAYDEIHIVATHGTRNMKVGGASTFTYYGTSQNVLCLWYRTCSCTTSKVTFPNCSKVRITDGVVVSNAENGVFAPEKIYGIKYND